MDTYDYQTLNKSNIIKTLDLYLLKDITQIILDYAYQVRFIDGSFYYEKPTAIYQDLYMRQKINRGKYYVPLSNMIYAEFNTYCDFSRKNIYEIVFKKLDTLSKTWNDLNYATSIDINRLLDYDDYKGYDTDINDLDISKIVSIQFDIKQQRNLSKEDYMTNTILFGFPLKPELYIKSTHSNNLCFELNGKTMNEQCWRLYWCGILYSEGHGAVGNFCTNIHYFPANKVFEIDGECA